MKTFTCYFCNNRIQLTYSNTDFYCYNCPNIYPHIKYIEYYFSYYHNSYELIVSIADVDYQIFPFTKNTKYPPITITNTKYVDIAFLKEFIPYAQNNKIEKFIEYYHLLK